MKSVVKLAQHIFPLLLPLGDLVKLLFYLRGKRVIQHVREILGQEVVHHHRDVGREQLFLLGTGDFGQGFGFHLGGGHLQGELLILPFFSFPVFFFYVTSLLNGRDGGGVGRRTTDAHLL